MKNILFSICFICALTFSVNAQGLKNIAHGSIATGTSTYNAKIECSYSDNSGNFYLAGASKNSIADFDVFGPGVSYGESGLYFYFNKYDALGNLLFSQILTTTSTTTSTTVGIRGIVTDATGNIYITGTFDGIVDFDPSAVTNNINYTTGKTFLAKYDSNGSLLWVKNFGALSTNTNNVVPEDIAINPTTGKIFIAGWFVSNASPYVDFDPGATNTSTMGNSFARCGFFAAYNPADGSYVANSYWGAVSVSPTIANVEVKSIQLDNANSIYAVGQFQNTFTATGLTYTNSTPTGFIIKKPTTTSGSTADATGSIAGVSVNDIDIDASNNIYIGGQYFDLGSGFLIKYNSSLVQSWIKYPAAVINSIAINSSNQILTLGQYYSTHFVQFYNSNGSTNFGANGLQIPVTYGYIQQFTKEVQFVGNNVLIGVDFYTSNSSWATQDFGFNHDTIQETNPSSSNRQYWGIYEPDFIGPMATISTTASDPTTTSPIPVTITFDEKQYGFDINAFIINNATVSNLIQINNTTFTADFTPVAPGLIDGNIDGSNIFDYQNNQGQGSNYFYITYNSPDVTPPTLNISSTSSDPTNVSPIPVTFTFSETVTGFTITDISVTNGTAGNFAGTGNVYTADITPTTQGIVTINVASGVCIDGASNQNTVSNTLSRTYDNINPTVVVSSTSSDPTNVSPIPVTFTFSETVTGFTITDISVTNGTAGNFAGTGNVYTADITPTTQGIVTINVASGVCTDGASNLNTASNTLSRTYDNINPTVVVSSTSSDPTNVSPIPVTFTFSETVTGFTITDISVTNGTAGNFAGTGNVYTADITPTTQGIVTINVASGVCIDGASNQNTVSNTLSRTYDNINPTVVVSSTSPDPTNVSPIPVTFTFSETVTGFTITDISVTNGTAGNFAGTGNVYTADITPTTQGIVTINVASGVCIDGASNQNTVSNTLSRTYDNINPTVVVSSTSSDPTNVSPIPVTFTFSETVNGFTITDISVTNGTAGNFAGTGNVYTADITPTTQGMVTISIAANTCTDIASNQNNSSNTLTRNYNNVAPTVTVSSSSADPTNTTPIPVTFIFSAAVTGFTISDIIVTNGTAGNFAGTGNVYTADITPTTQGTVTIYVAAGVCVDGASNQNTASNTLSRNFDNINPSVVISSTATNPTTISPIPITISFSESVIGFDISDLIISNGTPSNFSGSGNLYFVDITPSVAGNVIVNINNGVCSDNATNPNDVATQFSILYQTTGNMSNIVTSAEITIFPNPTTGNITINKSTYEPENVVLYDASGNIVFKKEINDRTEDITLQAVPGVYFINIGNKVNQKIIINK